LIIAFGGALKMGNLVEFVNQGGNVLLAADQYSEAMKDFAFEFSCDFASDAVSDPVNSVGDAVCNLEFAVKRTLLSLLVAHLNLIATF
jgi:hypothetical protein